MAFELEEKDWKLPLGDGSRDPSRYTAAAGDTVALLGRIAKAKARCGIAPAAGVHSCDEAGRRLLAALLADRAGYRQRHGGFVGRRGGPPCWLMVPSTATSRVGEWK